MCRGDGARSEEGTMHKMRMSQQGRKWNRKRERGREREEEKLFRKQVENDSLQEPRSAVSNETLMRGNSSCC